MPFSAVENAVMKSLEQFLRVSISVNLRLREEIFALTLWDHDM
jgi:hypothetical protein